MRLAEPVGGDAELAQHAAGFDAGLGEMARLGLVTRLARRLPNATCTADVAVASGGLDLGDAVVRHVDHGHRDGIAIVGEDAGHADLAAD